MGARVGGAFLVATLEPLDSVAPREADEDDPLGEGVPQQLARVGPRQPEHQLAAQLPAVIPEPRHLPPQRRLLRLLRRLLPPRRLLHLLRGEGARLLRLRRLLRLHRAPLRHRGLLARRLQLRLEAPQQLEVARRAPAPVLRREQLELLLGLLRSAPRLGQLEAHLLLRRE